MNDTPMLFCLVPDLVYYDGTEAPDIPEGMNFLPIEMREGDATAELLFGALSKKTSLPTADLGAVTDGYVSGVTVVFCTRAANGALVTVGWYGNANVTETPNILPCENDDGSTYDHRFFFCTRRENAVLLPPEDRFAPKWAIPRNKSGKKGKYGFGGDAVWLAAEPEARAWKENFCAQIQAYTGDDLLSEEG